MLIEVFKTGTHTDSNGISIDYTVEMLDKIVQNYQEQVNNNTNNLAPLVKGHPHTNEPALGWVKKIFRRGNKLIAHIINISDELIAEIKKEKYKNFSIALYSNLNLRHIGILGAIPPAVKDLNKNGIIYFHKENIYNEYDFQAKIENQYNSENNFSSFELEKENNNLKDKIIEYSSMLETLQNTNKELVNDLMTLHKVMRQKYYSEFADSIDNSNKNKLNFQQKTLLYDILEYAFQLENNNNTNSNNGQLTNAYNNYNDYCENKNSMLYKIKNLINELTKMDANKTHTHSDLLNDLNYSSYNDTDNKQKSNVNIYDIDLELNRYDSNKLQLHQSAIEYCREYPNVTYAEAVDIIINSKF